GGPSQETTVVSLPPAPCAGCAWGRTVYQSWCIAPRGDAGAEPVPPRRGPSNPCDAGGGCPRSLPPVTDDGTGRPGRVGGRDPWRPRRLLRRSLGRAVRDVPS